MKVLPAAWRTVLLCAALTACQAVVVLPSPVPLPPVEVSSHAGDACSKGYDKRRELAHGRFIDHRWGLSFYRGAHKRPCLVDQWTEYGSIFRFRVYDHRPRLGVLNLSVSTPPSVDRTAYIVEAYVTPQVSRVTFALDGRKDVVRLVQPRDWTRLRKDLLIHFVRGRRFNRDVTGRLRAFSADGRLLATRLLRRRDFFDVAEAG